MFRFLKHILLGFLIGLGAILPGISSGVICVSIGIYEKLINSIFYFFKDFKKSFIFLLPISIGMFIGVIGCAKFLNSLYIHYPNELNSVFIGLILGCIPKLAKEVNTKSTFKFSYIFFILFFFFIGVLSTVLKTYISYSYTNINFLYLIVSGVFMSFGVIIPGISSTVILIILGIYQNYLYAISAIYLPILFPLGIGLICGCLLCIILTKFLFKRYYSYTFYSIIGLSLGSTILLLPHFSFSINFIIYVLLILLGFIITV